MKFKHGELPVMAKTRLRSMGFT